MQRRRITPALWSRRAAALGLASLPSLAGPAVAQELQAPQEAPTEVPTEVHNRLLNLQEQIDELTARLETTPTIGSTRGTMKVFGRIHIDNWTYPSSDGAISVFENGAPDQDVQNRTLFRRARIGVSGKVKDSMNYKIEIDFGLPDAFAFKDMVIGFEDLPGSQRLLIGNQKRPYGLDHLNSSRYNVFIERPYVVEALNQDARRFGVVAYGQSEDLAWNWRYGGFHLENFATTGQISGDTFQPEFAARIANTAMWENDGRDYAHWAVSGTVAFPNGDASDNEARFRTRPEARTDARWLDTSRITGTDQYEIAAVEGVYNIGPTQLVGEYMNTWVERDDARDLQFAGGYVQLAHFLTGEYMVWDRRTGTLGRPKPSKNFAPGVGKGAWQIAARYSVADFSNRDILGGRGESLSLGVNWYWNANASMQLNYIRGEISQRDEEVGGQLFDGGDYEVLGVRLRIDF
ncbi:Porin P precursor [Planctomycetes bacterium Poly30]|uniref:Porin P n=1 Tax=Saltatorellus ferox TaxID=2528018 RepID=A0A518EKF7_9BACT|nr:Porin P precursor [Planctomycetes bacterium Poly30]